MFDESAQRTSILALARVLEDAWNRGDAAGFAAPFTDDASFVAWNGLHGYGRQAIEGAHRPLFEGPLAGSRMVLVDDETESGRPESLRFVRPDVAIMVTAGTTIPATGPDHDSVQTFVLVHDGGRWQATAFHNTRQQVQS